MGISFDRYIAVGGGEKNQIRALNHYRYLNNFKKKNQLQLLLYKLFTLLLMAIVDDERNNSRSYASLL